MIDSVIFRVNNLRENEALILYLESLGGGKAATDKALDEPLKPSREIFIKRYFTDFASGKTYSRGYSGFVKSHHYNAAFYINTDADWVEFNVSLPKYYFGTNVLQLVDHYNDKNYLHFRNNEFWNCKQVAFKAFRLILNRFLTGELMGLLDGKKQFIELRRIDFCFNLVFRTKSDAQYYLNELKSVRRKKFSTTSAVQTNYYSGLYFPSRDYTVKVYHKGTEFKKHDFNKIKKRYGRDVAQKLGSLADCILRYEVEFRPGYLTELFRKIVKTERPDIYRALKWSRQMSSKGYISKDGVKFNFDGQSGDGDRPRTKVYMRILPDDRRELKIGDHLRKRDIRFRLDVPSDRSLMTFQREDIISSYDFVEEFNYNMFEACVLRFKDIFMHFQLGNYATLNVINFHIKQNQQDEFKRKIGNMMGKTIYDQLSQGKIRWLIDLLRDHSWDDIKEKSLLPKTSFYRYKKFFDKLNMGERAVDYSFSVKFDYQNYYDLIIGDFNYLTQKTSFH
jgi:hypothetical protein